MGLKLVKEIDAAVGEEGGIQALGGEIVEQDRSRAINTPVSPPVLLINPTIYAAEFHQ